MEREGELATEYVQAVLCCTVHFINKFLPGIPIIFLPFLEMNYKGTPVSNPCSSTHIHILSLICSSIMMSAEVTLTLCGWSRDVVCTFSPPCVGQGSGAFHRLAVQRDSLPNQLGSLHPAFRHRRLR